MRVRMIFFICSVLLAAIFSPLNGWAEVVKEISPEGTLTLASGEKVALAGVQFDPEGISVLKVLANKQDLRMERLSDSEGGAQVYAYVYLRAKFLPIPFKPSNAVGEEEILLNEFLLQIGAARVVEDREFKKKQQFLEIQEKAKKKGEGIWSYAVL